MNADGVMDGSQPHHIQTATQQEAARAYTLTELADDIDDVVRIGDASPRVAKNAHRSSKHNVVGENFPIANRDTLEEGGSAAGSDLPVGSSTVSSEFARLLDETDQVKGMLTACLYSESS